VADQIYPGMWRILDRDGNLSDLGNITRIKDAAVAIAMADYDNQVRRRVERRAGSPYSAHMLTADGRTLIERIAETNLLPAPEVPKVVQLGATK
jgi:hypothetical protein